MYIDNSIIEDKINKFIEFSANNDVDKSIKYLLNIFSKDEYEIEKIRYNSQYYKDFRDIIYLTNGKNLKLIIRYPGGDLSYKEPSDPNHDIYLKWYDEEKKKDIFIFFIKNDVFNKNNNRINIKDIIKKLKK